MTALDFKLYQKGKTHRYFGGTFDSGEIRFVLPFDSVWHAVVEQGSYNDPLEVRATCSLCEPDRDIRSSVALDAPEPQENGTEQIPSSHDDIADDAAEEAENIVDELIEKGQDPSD